MSPKLKKTDRILIGLGSFNPDGLSSGSKCYFQHADGSHSSEDVSKKIYVSETELYHNFEN